MHENDDHLTKKFMSSDVSTRIKAAQALYSKLRDRMFSKFYSRTGRNWQDTEDLIQQTYVNFDKR